MLDDFGGMVGVWAGAESLLNIPPSWEGIAKRIHTYTLREVLDVVGRISAVLHNSASSDQAVQLALCDLLFSPVRAAVLRRRLELMALRRARDDPGPFSTLVLFGYRSLLVLVQVAVHVCDPTSEHLSGGPYDEMGEALLIANDLAEAPGISPHEEDLNTEAGLRKWIFYLTTAAAQRGSDPAVHIVTRAVDLFLSSHPGLRDDADYIDLQALFLETTGLTVRAYTLAFLAFVGALYGISLSNVKEREATVPRSLLQGEQLRFSAKQVQQFFSLIGDDVATFVSRVKEEFPAGSVRPYSYLPFELSPVVLFPTLAVCASLPLLEEKLASGLYHTLLNAKSGKENKSFRARFQRFVGRVFEEYVTHAFRRISNLEEKSYRPKLQNGVRTVRWIPESDIRASITLRGSDEAKVCDGILVLGDALFVVEAKARMFSLAARTGDSVDDFFKKLTEIVVDAGEQLDSVCKALVRGELQSIGLDPTTIRTVFPIVVSLQDLFMNRPLRNWIDGELQTRDILQQARMGRILLQPLEVIDVSDLEWLELVLEQGDQSLKGILSQKQREPMGPFVSLLSWGRIRKSRYLRDSARLKHHSARFASLSAGALDFFREHRVSEANQ